MKHILLVLSLLLLCSNTYAQTKVSEIAVKQEQRAKLDSVVCRIDTLLQMVNSRLDILDINTSLKQRYKLYSTENIYTFLKLDTKTGRIKQLQWSLDDDKEFSVTINYKDLTNGYGYGSGTFELYPTKNMYQFLLINKTSGETWHVQWGMEYSQRWIRKIY